MSMTSHQIKAFDAALEKKITDVTNGLETVLAAKMRLAIRLSEEVPDMKTRFGFCLNLADRHVESWIDGVVEATEKTITEKRLGASTRPIREIVVEGISREFLEHWEEKSIFAIQRQMEELNTEARRKREQRFPSKN